jgi:hypothetical protein
LGGAPLRHSLEGPLLRHSKRRRGWWWWWWRWWWRFELFGDRDFFVIFIIYI